MYGLVNKALEDMVKNRFGQPEWNEVRRRAGVDIEVFVSNHGYSDDITYKLVDAVCERTKLPADQVLKDFGRHWILKTARDGYGELLALGGKSVPEFLRNLPNFHARVSLIFPHLEPPRFQMHEPHSDPLGPSLSLTSRRTRAICDGLDRWNRHDVRN